MKEIPSKLLCNLLEQIVIHLHVNKYRGGKKEIGMTCIVIFTTHISLNERHKL